MIIYFSGTGNSAYCANFLGNKLDDSVINTFSFIHDNKGADLNSTKPWVFVCPTYAWRIPHIFEKFISLSNFNGSHDAYFVMTCGSEIGNTEKYIKLLCTSKNFNYKGVLQVVMPENYIAMFPVPQKDEALKIISKAKPTLEKGADIIFANKDFPQYKKSVVDKIKSTAVNPVFYKFAVSSNDFYSTVDCVGCGKCANICPLSNITIVNSKPKWSNNCTHCMACICSCPKQAIEYGKNSLGKPRYQCPQL